MRFLLAIFIACFAGSSAYAQACLDISPELATLVARDAQGKGTCEIACEGCGCKGGPGYRGPTGQCVSWKSLARTCGPPPYALCDRECAPVVVGCPNRADDARKKLEQSSVGSVAEKVAEPR